MGAELVFCQFFWQRPVLPKSVPPGFQTALGGKHLKTVTNYHLISTHTCTPWLNGLRNVVYADINHSSKLIKWQMKTERARSLRHISIEKRINWFSLMHGRGFTECSELTHTETEDEVAPVIPLRFWAAGIPPGQDTWVEQQ